MGMLEVVMLAMMVVEKNCQASKLNREDAMDHNRWMKQRRDD